MQTLPEPEQFPPGAHPAKRSAPGTCLSAVSTSAGGIQNCVLCLTSGSDWAGISYA